MAFTIDYRLAKYVDESSLGQLNSTDKIQVLSVTPSKVIENESFRNFQEVRILLADAENKIISFEDANLYGVIFPGEETAPTPEDPLLDIGPYHIRSDNISEHAVIYLSQGNINDLVDLHVEDFVNNDLIPHLTAIDEYYRKSLPLREEFDEEIFKIRREYESNLRQTRKELDEKLNGTINDVTSTPVKADFSSIEESFSRIMKQLRTGYEKISALRAVRRKALAELEEFPSFDRRMQGYFPNIK